MKKWMTMLVSVLLLAAMACAGVAEDERGVIYTQKPGGEVAMHAEASEDSTVLMNYFDGTVVTILASKGEWTKVRVGMDNASLTGYVPADALRGLEAQRERMAIMHIVDAELVKVYSAPDTAADVIHNEVIRDGITLNICGYNDEWVQRCSNGLVKSAQWASGADEGFMRRMGLEIRNYEEQGSLYVQPLAGELTHEQAYDLAIQHAVENADWLYRFDEDERNVESLRQMWWDVRYVYDMETGERTWQVFIQKDSVEYEKNILITMDAEGKLMDMESGNG